jgi:hypothetical protein
MDDKLSNSLRRLRLCRGLGMKVAGTAEEESFTAKVSSSPILVNWK